MWAWRAAGSLTKCDAHGRVPTVLDLAKFFPKIWRRTLQQLTGLPPDVVRLAVTLATASTHPTPASCAHTSTALEDSAHRMPTVQESNGMPLSTEEARFFLNSIVQATSGGTRGGGWVGRAGPSRCCRRPTMLCAWRTRRPRRQRPQRAGYARNGPYGSADSDDVDDLKGHLRGTSTDGPRACTAPRTYDALRRGEGDVRKHEPLHFHTLLPVDADGRLTQQMPEQLRAATTETERGTAPATAQWAELR